MGKYYYKRKGNNLKKQLRILSLGIFLLGVVVVFYVFFPLLSWEIYFKPVFASQNITAPIPTAIVVNPSVLKSLIAQAQDAIVGVDYTNAENWFPTFRPEGLRRRQKLNPQVASYMVSIPKINLANVLVSTIGVDLSKHLINYEGTSLPGELGNAVIFGHSTLPQLFNSKDYKTIFANLYKLKVGDKVISAVNGVSYAHKIYSISVVDPSDTSAFAQNYDNSYLTLVTCTPPGTVWKRLIIKARLESI